MMMLGNFEKTSPEYPAHLEPRFLMRSREEGECLCTAVGKELVVRRDTTE